MEQYMMCEEESGLGGRSRNKDMKNVHAKG